MNTFTAIVLTAIAFSEVNGVALDAEIAVQSQLNASLEAETQADSQAEASAEASASQYSWSWALEGIDSSGYSTASTSPSDSTVSFNDLLNPLTTTKT